MDIDRLDLNLLRVLDVLLEERHVTRAAARLALTQPAVSAALARLRASFNDALLVRGRGGLIATPRALELAPRVRTLMNEAGALLARPARFDAPQARRRFTLAATDYVQTLLEPWIARLMTSAPGVDIALIAPDAVRQVARMERGEIDLAILNLQRTPDGLRSRRVLVERFVVIGRRDHPALKHKLTLDTFCALEHVLVSPLGASFSGPTDEALAAIGRERRVRLSVQGFAPVVELVAASNLIAVYPERLARRAAPRLKIVAPPLAIAEFAMVAAWHERAQRDPAHQWLRDAVHAALAGDDPGKPRRKLGAP
jgi:DNA-binding transcriptional LysR family regulator